MGILGEFLIICLVTAAGIAVSKIPGFPLPGTVTGMMLMLLLFILKIVKTERVNKAAGMLVNYLPLLFIPLIVNITKESELLKSYGIKLLIVVVLSTFITMTVTALTAKLLFNLAKRKKGEGNG